MRFANLGDMVDSTVDRLRSAPLVHPARWQGKDVSKNPAAATHELTNIHITAPMNYRSEEELVSLVNPNLPWANQHFYERVGGVPLNPPPSWECWPGAEGAARHIKDEIFDHTYPERFWPTHANMPHSRSSRVGIRFAYGDLDDVLRMLMRDATTRQAFLPIFFPEDTGATAGQRTPCTIGYHFLMRDGKLNLYYPIRSCDAHNHFRDDVYLAVRLAAYCLEWQQQQAREHDNVWHDVVLGDFSMWIWSFHMFVNDHRLLFGSKS